MHDTSPFFVDRNSGFLFSISLNRSVLDKRVFLTESYICLFTWLLLIKIPLLYLTYC